MLIKTLKIQSSKGFSFLNGLNRAIIPAQVTKLAKSIDKIGIIRPVVVANISFITGKKETYVIDGQHLFHACLRANIDIPFVEIKIDNISDLVEKIALLNASSKSWTLQDYITAWQNVNKDYVKLSKYFNIYDLELSQIASLLHYGNIPLNTGGHSVTKNIKNGSFKISNELESVKIMDYITDVLKIVPRMDRMSNKLFVSCYVQLYLQWKNSYNHKDYLNYLSKNKNKFILATNDPEEFKELMAQGIK